MDAVIYCRISNDPTGKQAGVDRQRKECEQLAADMNLNVVRTLIDNDTSASNGRRRPGFEEVLGLIRDGIVDTVIVWHTDRLYRLPRDLEPLIGLADSRRLRFLTVTASEIDLNNASGRLVARMLAAASAAEVERMSERMRAANRDRTSRGRTSTRPRQRPFGFEADGIEHRPDEVQAIREGYDAILNDASLAAVARQWNAAGFTTSRSQPWSSGSVGALLVNPRYMGMVTYHRKAVGEAEWAPIVDEATWRAAHARLRASMSGTQGRPRTLLGKLAMCGVCGAPVQGGSNNGRRSYRCSGPVQHLSRKAEDVERYVSEVMVARLSRPDAAELLTVEGDDMEPVAVEAEQLRLRLDSLADEWAVGELTASQLRTATARLRTRLSELEAQLETATHRGGLALRLAAQSAGDAWAEMDVDSQRQVVRELAVVTLLQAPRGRKTFDPSSVAIQWVSN